jgi:hypothetical protein
LFPVTNVTASLGAGHINISFLSRGGSLYSVLFKTNVADASWSVLTNGIPGTGGIVTVTDPISRPRRFYRVQTQ